MRLYISELRTMAARMEAMINHSIDKSKHRGDEWCFLCDGLIDTKQKLDEIVRKIRVPPMEE